jgi:hypothetical protein
MADEWVKEFFQMLTAPRLKGPDRARAIQFKNARVPSKLYRYRMFDEKGWSLLELEDDTVWLNAADTFNDPFDSQFAVAYKQIRMITLKKLEDTIRYAGLHKYLTPDDIEKIKAAEDPIVEMTKIVAPKFPDVTPEMLEKLTSGALDKMLDEMSREPVEALSASLRQKDRPLLLHHQERLEHYVEPLREFSQGVLRRVSDSEAGRRGGAEVAPLSGGLRGRDVRRDALLPSAPGRRIRRYRRRNTPGAAQVA